MAAATDGRGACLDTHSAGSRRLLQSARARTYGAAKRPCCEAHGIWYLMHGVAVPVCSEQSASRRSRPRIAAATVTWNERDAPAMSAVMGVYGRRDVVVVSTT